MDPFSRTLVAVDGSLASAVAVGLALQLARPPRYHAVRFVSVVDRELLLIRWSQDSGAPCDVEHIVAAAQAVSRNALDEAIDRACTAQVEATCTLRAGRAVDAILDEAFDCAATCIVVGAHGRAGGGRRYSEAAPKASWAAVPSPSSSRTHPRRTISKHRIPRLGGAVTARHEWPARSMKRAAVTTVSLLLVLTALAFWHFRSSATRLTELPPRLAQAVLSRGRGLPKTPRSVIVVVEGNQSYEKILDDQDSASYIAALAKEGALFTRSAGVAHPSQPNYFALFAGRINPDGDTCPSTTMPVDAPNLGAELLAAHRTFRAYVEDLPSPGYGGCASGEYARKHAPWTQFANVPARDAVPFADLRSYDALPDVAFIIPNLVHDMHSASVDAGDAWLRQNVDPLVAWAKQHDALVILTWDESDSPVTNWIPTIFVGPMVRPGRYAEPITHYRVLRTIEDLFGLPHAGHAAEAAPITNVWR